MALPPAHRLLRNVKLIIEYDGSAYAGWQIQPNARTVAGTIEEALAGVLGEEVRLVGAGRTDEGVHAEGQVANFLTRWKHPADGLVNALNDRLPDDIAILHACDIGPEFHSRHSAAARVYRYHVVRRRSVFMRRRALHVTRPMDLKLMRKAAESILGMHDFAAFADLRLNQDKSTKVNITYAGWKDVGGQLIFRIAGSHFLPRMVRRLVGCMVRVGLGELSLEKFQKWLETGEGESGPSTAPAMGLVLEHVEYLPEALEAPRPERAERPERAAREPERAARQQPAQDDSETHPVGQRAVEALERGGDVEVAEAPKPVEAAEPVKQPEPSKPERPDRSGIPRWKEVDA